MVKQIIILVFLLSTQFVWAMKLTSVTRNFNLKQNKDGLWISENCKNCQAETIYKTVTKEKLEQALKDDARGQIPIGTRLCSGLKGLVWVMLDEQNIQQAVCEFSDKSATLTSDLSELANKLRE
jgi:hypothetical protein